jgi:rfaE bifunctional protein, domain I
LSGFDIKRLRELFDNFSGKKIAVLGDLMLDRYVWGSVSRISPEAPVPVLEVENESSRLGGAANVANNIKSLGGEPIMVGIVGNDHAGEELRKIITDMGLSAEGVIIDDSRPTTVKTRVIAHNQHVVRMDYEVRRDIESGILKRITELVESIAKKADAILLEDYNKGMLTRDLINQVIKIALKHNIIVTVDPKRSNFFEYKRVSVFKPNRKEAEEALGIKVSNDYEAEEAARLLLGKLECETVLLTRGEKGMTLVGKDGSIFHFPTKAREVADVSGAGDTVISTLTLALTAGASVKEAAAIANHAGGIVCGEVGIVPVDKNKLFYEVANDSKSLDF